MKTRKKIRSQNATSLMVFGIFPQPRGRSPNTLGRGRCSIVVLTVGLAPLRSYNVIGPKQSSYTLTEYSGSQGGAKILTQNA